MSVLIEPPTSDDDATALTRRAACALVALAFGTTAVSKARPAAMEVEGALADRFAVKRRAYQTGDVDLLRSFYDDHIVIVGEGKRPLLGIEQVIAAYQALLPKRRDIEVSVLRSGHSPEADLAYQFVKFTAFAKDPAETLPIVSFLFLWRRGRQGWRCIVESLLLQDLSLTPGFSMAAAALEKRDLA
jgi:ketosteroid isomerase-like protein